MKVEGNKEGLWTQINADFQDEEGGFGHGFSRIGTDILEDVRMSG